jgi:pilus assembly protein CpaC
MYTRFLSGHFVPSAIFWAMLWAMPSAVFCQGETPPAPPSAANAASPATTLLVPPSVIFKVESPEDQLEMIVRTSRILTTDLKIQQQQVSNPDVAEATPIAPNRIQVSAKAIGLAQINLWDENRKLYTVNIHVVGDARELAAMLRSAFPTAALKVTPVANAVMIGGFVDRQEQIARIIRVAEEYYPKVINNMSVGGSQQVLLHVKVMEVSRTKMRQLGFDWAKITGSNIVSSGPTGLLSDYNPTALTTPSNLFRTAAPSTLAFNVGNSTNAFYGVLEALREDNLTKIMSEPTLVTVNGQTSTFNVGGQIPVPEPQSLGTISIGWKDYGTQVIFVPVVIGNGKIRLEVHPTVSELDYTNSVTINNSVVPAIKTRNIQTSVEILAGQTLAIAGLVQSTTQATSTGLPWVSEVPIIGQLFRSEQETQNEVELLILVTPEFAEALNADQVPKCGPGMNTANPSDWELFMNGHLEVPACCPAGDGQTANAQNSVAKSAKGPPDANSQASAAGRNNQQTRNNPDTSVASASLDLQKGPPEFIGPVGYEVVK